MLRPDSRVGWQKALQQLEREQEWHQTGQRGSAASIMAAEGAPRRRLTGSAEEKREGARKTRMCVLPWMKPILKEQQPKCWLDLVDRLPVTAQAQLGAGIAGLAAQEAGDGGLASAWASLAAALAVLHDRAPPAPARGLVRDRGAAP